jgi:hypothetical protein
MATSPSRTAARSATKWSLSFATSSGGTAAFRTPRFVRRVSYKDEFRKLLKLYEIEFDERYVWD